MRTRVAIDAALHLAVHKARMLPDGHPDHTELHLAIDQLLTERDQVGATLRPSHVRAEVR